MPLGPQPHHLTQDPLRPCSLSPPGRVSHVCHPWAPPVTVSWPRAPPRSSGCVTPHPSVPLPPVCPRAAASIIPVSPAPHPDEAVGEAAAGSARLGPVSVGVGVGVSGQQDPSEEGGPQEGPPQPGPPAPGRSRQQRQRPHHRPAPPTSCGPRPLTQRPPPWPMAARRRRRPSAPSQSAPREGLGPGPAHPRLKGTVGKGPGRE